MNCLARILLPVAATGAIALSIPAVASATDYCVKTSCGGTNVNTLEEALTEAKQSTDADRVFLGAGQYFAQSNFGFAYDGAGPVEIIGAGEDNTKLTAPLGSTAVLNLKGGLGSSVHDLWIEMPQYSNGHGLYTSNTARRIFVGEPLEQSHERSGVTLVAGGSLEDSEVRLTRESNATAVAFGAGGGTLRRSIASAGSGVVSRYGYGLVEGSQLTGSDFGVRALSNVTTVRSSLINVRAATEPASARIRRAPARL